MPALGFDAEPSSSSFGELRLAVPRDGAALTDRQRIRLVERAGAARSDLEQAFVVWTGAVEPATQGCRHPQEQPAILGEVRIVADGVIFEPRFPWVAGLDYTACLDPDGLLDALVDALDHSDHGGGVRQMLSFAAPVPRVTTEPHVVAVWPDVEEVPANLLRLYIHFSEPMHRRGVASSVRLLNPEGDSIAEPFVDIPDGLWDPEGRRLTIFVHPGRIKRGVGPGEALGAVLRAGESVVLEVDAALETARGVPLGASSRWSYRVGEADRMAPDPDRWITHAPALSSDALSLEFDEPLDRAQLATAVWVLREGEVVAGLGEAQAAGRIWSFVPAEPWRSGNYRVAVRRNLEDLAGNTVDRLFDIATADGVAAVAGGVVQPSGQRGDELFFDFTLDFTER